MNIVTAGGRTRSACGPWRPTPSAARRACSSIPALRRSGAARFGLPPEEAEWEALRRANDRIAAYAERAGWIFVSHYHDEHYRHDPAFAGRGVLARIPSAWSRGPRRSGRASSGSRSRGRARLDSADGPLRGDARLHPDRLAAAARTGGELSDLGLRAGADGHRPPLGRGASRTPPTSRDRCRPVAAAYLARERPSLLYLSGAARVSGAPAAATRWSSRGVEHLPRIIDRTGCRVIMDHHAVRSGDYRERFRRLWDTGQVVTAAGYLGLADTPLETQRRAL